MRQYSWESKAGKSRPAKATCCSLKPEDEKGALNTFIQDHDDGQIIGISIEVSDLNKACSLVEGHSGNKLEP
jgi:hypothetical protein